MSDENNSNVFDFSRESRESGRFSNHQNEETRVFLRNEIDKENREERDYLIKNTLINNRIRSSSKIKSSKKLSV